MIKLNTGLKRKTILFLLHDVLKFGVSNIVHQTFQSLNLGRIIGALK